MSKPRPPVFERGVSAKFPGVARPYTHGHVGRHGLTYEHAADGGRWRSTRAGERTGIYDDHALSYTRYSYPADGDVVLHPDDATHAVYGGIDDELADARHTVAFPPDVGDLVQKLHATMKEMLLKLQEGYEHEPGAYWVPARLPAGSVNRPRMTTPGTANRGAIRPPPWATTAVAVW